MLTLMIIAYVVLSAAIIAVTFFSTNSFLYTYGVEQAKRIRIFLWATEGIFIVRTIMSYEIFSAVAILCAVLAVVISLPLLLLTLRRAHILRHGTRTNATATRINLGGAHKGKCTLKYQANFGFFTIPDYPAAAMERGMETDVWFDREHPNQYSSKPLFHRALIWFLATLPISAALLYVFFRVVFFKNAHLHG